LQDNFARTGRRLFRVARILLSRAGARIHQHRDLTGAGLNNRLRFHIPIVTNPLVDFRVSGEKVMMEPGDLWCLDTSYVHSVENSGTRSRVHIVVECGINNRVRSEISRGLRVKLHDAHDAGLLAWSFAKSILKTSRSDPEYFCAQMGMVKKFIAWRVFGSERIQ
jgi:hypothetical protein